MLKRKGNFFHRALAYYRDFARRWKLRLCDALIDRKIRIMKLCKARPASMPHSYDWIAGSPEALGYPGEIRLFMVIRNESLRLPYFFRYYSKMGVDRFFIVDNGSTDATPSFLSSQSNTHVFKTSASFRDANNGTEWLNALVNRYGRGHWCLVVDADEIFIYPHYEDIAIKDLCRFLEEEGHSALGSILLDMYSDTPIRSVKYSGGEDLLPAFPYFDKNSHCEVRGIMKRFEKMITGGMRERVFGALPNLRKVPLFKFNTGMSLCAGQHDVNGIDLSGLRGATLHFKYTPDFIPRVLEEAENTGGKEYLGVRKWHMENESYARKVRGNPDINLYYCGSVKFKDSRQLVGLGIMNTSGKFEAFVKNSGNYSASTFPLK